MRARRTASVFGRGPRGPDERVDRGRLAVVERDRSLDLLGPLDHEALERGGDVLRREQHGDILRAAVAVDEVRRVVPQDEQRPSRSDRAGGALQRPGELLVRKLQVEHRHEVERRLLRLVLEDVRDDPVDVDAATLGEARALPERDVREVDRRHRPAALGEPDGVPPLAAGEVERPPGLQPADLGGEEPVRLGRPDELLLRRVTRVPVLARERRRGPRTRTRLLGHSLNLPAPGRRPLDPV